jgi:hypothetical protein
MQGRGAVFITEEKQGFFGEDFVFDVAQAGV